jgi:hypothetical protein
LLTVHEDDVASPISTGLMIISQWYTKIRCLIAEQAHENLTFLPPIKKLRIFSLFGPQEDALTLINLGVFGSSMEGPTERPDHWMFLRLVNENHLSMIKKLPHFYTNIVKINPQHIV